VQSNIFLFIPFDALISLDIFFHSRRSCRKHRGVYKNPIPSTHGKWISAQSILFSARCRRPGNRRVSLAIANTLTFMKKERLQGAVSFCRAERRRFSAPGAADHIALYLLDLLSPCFLSAAGG